MSKKKEEEKTYALPAAAALMRAAKVGRLRDVVLPSGQRIGEHRLPHEGENLLDHPTPLGTALGELTSSEVKRVSEFYEGLAAAVKIDPAFSAGDLTYVARFYGQVFTKLKSSKRDEPTYDVDRPCAICGGDIEHWPSMKFSDAAACWEERRRRRAVKEIGLRALKELGLTETIPKSNAGRAGAIDGVLSALPSFASILRDIDRALIEEEKQQEKIAAASWRSKAKTKAKR